MDILSEAKKHARQGLEHNLTAIGIGIVFTVFGAWELANPMYWQAYLPHILKDLHPLLLIQLHGSLMIVAGLGVNTARFRKESGIISSLIMLEIVISLAIESGFSDILIRDIGLLFMALSFTTKSFRDQYTNQ